MSTALRTTVVLALILATGCSLGGATGTPAASLTASPTKALKCKLPAMSAIDLARGDNPAAGGFVTIPGGQFTADPRAAASGAGRPVYDPAIGDWLPKPGGDLWHSIDLHLLAPDGLKYVYETETPRPPNPNGPTGAPLSLAVHVVDVRTASDRVVFESRSPLLDVVGYSPPIIFLTPICFECGAGGSTLWTLDERNGSVRKISDLSSYWSIANGAAWGGVTTTSTAMDRFVRIDADGTVTTWMSLPGTDLRLVALGPDASPLVQASIANAEAVWRVPEPEKGQEVFRVSSGGLSGAFSDQYGTWIGGAQSGDGAGIFLYTTGGGLRKMSDFPGVPLGACV
jgi:hypothetical protein